MNDAEGRLRSATLPGAWMWLVPEDRVVLSDWLLRDRALPPAARVSTIGSLIARVVAEDRDYVETTVREAGARRRAFAMTYRVIDGLGRVRTVTNAADVVPGEPTRMIGATVDLAAVTAAAPGEAPFVDAILETLVDGLVAVTRSGVPIIVNGAARKLFEAATGLPWEDHAGRLWIERLLVTRPPHGQLAPWRHPVGLALAGTPVSDIEIGVGEPGGTRRVVLLSARPIRLGGPGSGEGAVVTLHDVTEQRAAEERLARDATHDRVTGLPNRRLLFEQLAEALSARSPEPLAAVVVELDGVAGVNERLGYDAVEAVVAGAARALAGELGPHDFAAALGGESLAVVCTDRPGERAEALAARIVRAVATPRAVAGPGGGDPVEVTVTARAGIARATPESTTESILNDAQAAAGTVPAGGGVATYEADDELVAALRAAIPAGELVLHYQPKLSVDSRRITGVEALVRWQRPGHGLVPPGAFIPAAERAGLVAELGGWVLRTALADAGRWSGVAPAGFRVCVNVSAPQFDAAFTDVVTGAIAAAGVEPRVLCVEVTESVLMEDVASAVGTLRALRDLGVTVAIDDFGTGYSSLAYLRDFPADELKVDRSFVAELGNGGTVALVGGIVSIAHALSLDVVAEGVETAEQLAALETIGCDTVQGYLFSMPVPARDIDAWLADEPARVAATRGTGVADDVVLVADDADDVRLLARMSLATAGFEVHEARDGRTALDIARTVRPRTVVLDLRMPELDGLAVCRALRADPATAGCTIVMLTATGSPADKVAAYSAGADEYIVKPFTPRDLVSRVRAARRRRAEQEAGR